MERRGRGARVTFLPAELIPQPPALLVRASPMVVRLHELLLESADELSKSWIAAVPDPKAQEGLATFLTELKAALRGATVECTPCPRGPEPEVDETHDPGVGFDPVAATRAYGVLHGALLEAAEERGIEVGLEEQKVLASHVNQAIARAVMGHMRTQHRELRRIAHELRNPLGSAMMALTLLRSRADLGENTRLAEMLERNLQRVERGLDEALASEPRIDRGP
jgi:signal transduction histidine kinase